MEEVGEKSAFRSAGNRPGSSKAVKGDHVIQTEDDNSVEDSREEERYQSLNRVKDEGKLDRRWKINVFRF